MKKADIFTLPESGHNYFALTAGVKSIALYAVF